MRCASGTPSAPYFSMIIFRVIKTTALILILAMASCTPMIEDGRDHRHDPRFEKDRTPRRSG